MEVLQCPPCSEPSRPRSRCVSLTACSPEEIDRFFHSTEPTRAVLTDGQLEALRSCESTDNYSAVSASGRYRGAYQFSQTTWNDVAGRHFDWLVGVDPAAAEFWWQDAMARALFPSPGRGPGRSAAGRSEENHPHSVASLPPFGRVSGGVS